MLNCHVEKMSQVMSWAFHYCAMPAWTKKELAMHCWLQDGTYCTWSAVADTSPRLYIYISTIAGRDYCSKHRSRSFLLLIFVMKQRGWEKISLILFFPSQLKWEPDRRKREWRATAASITYPPLMHDWKTSASLEDCIIYTRQNQEASSSYS